MNTLKQSLIEDPFFWAAVTGGIGHVTTGSLFGFRAFSHATSLGNSANQMFKIGFFGKTVYVHHCVIKGGRIIHFDLKRIGPFFWALMEVVYVQHNSKSIKSNR